MNVKQLKAYIETLPDDTLLVVRGSDHSYRKVRAEEMDACINEAERDLTECYWETKKQIKENLGPGYVKIPILLFD